MFFFFFAFNAAISQHLCVCQPDRPGSVCTLDKKCQNFKNEDQILLIEKKPSRNAKSLVNIFQILQKNKKKGENQINLAFDVFGSLPSNPIIFDFSETEKIIKNEENLQVSIKIKGNEWKQVINITGLDSISSNAWSNYSAYNLSLSISDIAVLFDVDENHSSSAFFDTLKIQKSRLIVPEKKSFTFNTRNLYTDTISSYSDFTGKIITNEMTFLDTKDPVKIKNFQSPIEVKSIEEPKIKREIKAEEEKIDLSDFQFRFCLSTKDYNDRAFEDKACEMHSVPHDNQHYISVKSTDIVEIIKNAPSNNIIRFYLTGASAVDPCTFILPQFNYENHTIYFQVADPDVPTYLTLKGSNSGGQEVEDNNVNTSFHTISTVTIDVNLLASFRNVTLRSSPIIFADDADAATVQNLVTDSNSIAQFSGTLNISGSIEMKKTTPRRIKGSILMEDNSTIIIPQLSNFPVILFKESLSVGQVCISFCDEGEHIEMPFNFYKEQLINIVLSDNVPTVVGPIDLIFRNDAPQDFVRTDEYPKINCTTYVPRQGLNVTFGTEQTIQWPRYSVFIFENILDDDNSDNFPLIFLTILDGSEIITTDEAKNSIFLFFYKVNIVLLSYSSFAPYLNGVNKKHDLCPDIPLPSFAYKHLPKCFQTGVYGVGYTTLDIFDILKTVQFDGSKIFLAVTSGDPIKVPYVSEHVVMLTTSEEIEYDLDPLGNASDLTRFTLQPSVETTVTFTNNFVDIIKDHETALEKLNFIHNANDINLKTLNGESVPHVILDDPVQGVHFITRDNDSPVEYYVTDDSYKNSWVGPNVEVKYSNDITVPQTAFLADSVIFEASSANTKVNFIYYNKSVTDYTFRNSVLSFTNSDKEVKSVDFSAKSVVFDKSTVTQDTKSVALNFEVDRLDIKDLASIPASSFSSPIIIHESASIIVEKITKIIFSKGSIKVFNGDIETPVITHIPTTAQVSTQKSDTPTSAKSLLADDQTSQTGFTVETPTDDQIDLEVEGSALPEDFQLKLTGENPNVFIDKSFNNVKVPDTFDITAKDKYNIKTDLRELPNGIGDGAVNIVHSKQKLTNNLGFIIFVIIFAVIFIVAIILCVVGLTCMPQPEQYDVSSEGKDNIFDERDVSDDQNKGDGEMDVTSSGADNEVEEVEKKKKEDEVANDQEKQPEGSYSVEIEQGDQSTDSAFFDDVDESTGKKPK